MMNDEEPIKTENIKRGRPSTITLSLDKKDVSLDDDNIKQILKSRVKAFSNSGAYIPLSQEYEGHEVVVIVMNKK